MYSSPESIRFSVRVRENMIRSRTLRLDVFSMESGLTSDCRYEKVVEDLKRANVCTVDPAIFMAQYCLTHWFT